MNKPTRKIEESLIYEMVDGQPIYYHGYKDVLKGRKDAEAIMGSSFLQSLIVGNLVFILKRDLPGNYLVLTNEVGVLFSKNNWRAADIAILDREVAKRQENEKGYLTVPPKVVVEIDTKAALDDNPDRANYYHKKTDQLLDFGIEKVVWIFTESEKVMVAEKGKPWMIYTWQDRIEILEGIEVVIGELAK